MRRKTVVPFLFAVMTINSFALAGDWGHWRGPNGNGSASDAAPPTVWSSTKNVKWKVEIPEQGSCYPMAGEWKWKRDDFGKIETRNSFGEGISPTLDGDRILVPWDHEGPSALYALDKLNGETIWKPVKNYGAVPGRQSVATNELDETVDATPAPVDRELFIRGEKHLFCIAESK